jgi:glyoxylase-like metal-dependent hydrolase (beta-lactamase superfamily II)
MVSPVSLGCGIWLIDSNALGIKGYCSSYVVSSEGEHMLVETGPSTSIRSLLHGIEGLGCDLMSFTNIILTHIHFDHAGGVGDIADKMPNATVVVQERGARHIIDPSRLIESAKKVFGDSLSLYGEFKPVKQDRVRSVNDGDQVTFRTGRKLRVIYAPGHALHEICILDEETRSLFTGDAVGLHFSDTDEVVPTTPPPEFDMDLALETMDRLAKLNPTRLLFSHFGVAANAQSTLAEAKRKMMLWGEKILEIFGGLGTKEDKLRKLSFLLDVKTKVLPTAFKYEHRSNSISGYLRFYRNKKNLQI